ncbi:MAG: hypothetical protein AAGI01_06420 [Myxococcota bacterium]
MSKHLDAEALRTRARALGDEIADLDAQLDAITELLEHLEALEERAVFDH